MTLDEAMRAAIAHHQGGRLAEAEQLYRAVLQVQAQHPDANHNLGALALQMNQPAAALPFLQAALSVNPGHPQYWQSVAQALIGLQRWDEATALLDRAAAQGMVLAGAAQLRAQVAAAGPAPTLPEVQALLEAGNFSQALTAATRLTAVAPAEAGAWACLALARLQLKDLMAAEQAALNAVALGPGNLLSLRALASVRLRQQRPGDAIHLAQQALAAEPRSAHALMLLGSAKAMLGELDEADALLASALLIEPLAEAHANRAIVAVRRGQPEQAVAQAEQAVRSKPFLVSIWQLLVGLYQQADRPDQVIDALEHIIAQEPGNAPALSDLGELRRRAGRLDEARGLLARAVAADPQHADAWRNYAATLQDLDRPEEALAAITTAIALQPGSAEAFQNRADVLKRMGQMDAAVQSYREALALQPRLAEAHNNLGNAYKDMNRRSEAIESFHAAIALKPEMAELHANLGHAHKQFGDVEEALAAYRSTLALQADHGDARYGIGNVLWQLGRLDQALESFQHMVNAGPGDFFSWAAAVDSAILYFLKNDLVSAQAAIERAAPLDHVHTEQARPVRAYYRYMQKLLAWWRVQGSVGPCDDEAVPPLYVLGDSHSLSAHGLLLNHRGRVLRGQALLVKGVKQWHLGRPDMNQQRQQLERLWPTLPAQATVLLTVGEIDCRMDEGIFKAWQKAGGTRPIEALLMPTLDNFIARLKQLLKDGGRTVILCGVPACNMPLTRLSPEDQLQFLQMLGLFNRQLASLARQSGLGFADVFALTDVGGGQADGQWHIDQIHLRPDAIQAAFQNLHPH